MFRLIACTAALALTIVSIGCAQARFVEQTADGGVVAVPSPAYEEDAFKLIREHHCPSFVVIRREEVPVGVRTTADSDTRDAQHGGTRTRTTTRERVETEWRITYRCD